MKQDNLKKIYFVIIVINSVKLVEVIHIVINVKNNIIN